MIGLSNKRDLIIWRYDRFVPHRVLHGHSNWIDALIVASRRPYKERLLRKDKTDDIPGKEKTRKTPVDTKTLVTETGVRVDGTGKPILTPNKKDELEMYSGSTDGVILRWIPNPDINKDTWIQSELSKKSQFAIVCMMHHPGLDILITGTFNLITKIPHPF